MSRVTLDESLRGRLNGLNEHLELCDAAGQVVGHFLPDQLYQKLLYAADRCPYSDEEMRQHMAEPGGRTLAEIWQRLGRT